MLPLLHRFAPGFAVVATIRYRVRSRPSPYFHPLPACLLLPRFAVVATILESGVDLSAPGSNLLPNVVSAGLIGASVSAVYLYQAVFASAAEEK